MKHRVKIGSFLKRIKDTVDIEDATVYKRVTIKIRHQGILLRDTHKGSLIGTKKQFYVKDGQFLLSKIDARFGAFGIVPKEVDGGIITGNFWTYEVDKKKVNIDWFNLFTSSGSFYEICDRASSGTTHRKYLDEKAFLNFEIVLPDINEQNRFIEWYKDFYSKHNSLTQEINSQLSTIQLLRQAILQEAVQGKLVPQDQTDEPATELLKRIKAEKTKQAKKGKTETYEPITDIPYEIPKGWVWCRLGEIVEPISGVTLGKLYSEDTKKVPYLRVANVQRGYINLADLKELNVPDSEIDKYRLLNGDILMIEGGDWDKVGRCAILQSNIKDLIHQNHIYRMRFFDFLSNEYFSLFLNSPISRIYFASCSKQTTNLASINKTQLKNTPIALPSFKEQKRIVAKVKQLMHLCDELEAQVQQSKADAEKLLQAVLREAFEGKMAVDEQPATRPNKSFREIQSLWYILAAKKNIPNVNYYGEMGLAKETYLVDRLFDVNTGFTYVNWHWGPYDPRMKEIINGKSKYFTKKGNKGREYVDINIEKVALIEKYPFADVQKVNSAVKELDRLFSTYPPGQRTHKIELLATVCKVIEDTKSTVLPVIRKAMIAWQIKDKNVTYKNKAEKFSEDETYACLKFIINRGWDMKLIHYNQ